MQKKLTSFQIGCMQSFMDLEMKKGRLARIDYKGAVGVTVTTPQGKQFYSLNTIMDPINRFLLSPSRQVVV